MILGVESSCDESSLALVDPIEGVIVAEIVASQIDLHREYGGVVPDLASRAHLENFAYVFEQLKQACPEVLDKVTSIAVTRGPGLAGCLALGIAFAKSLAVALDVPVVGVNHLRGHLYSPFIPVWVESRSDWSKTYSSLLPHLGLIVSGGNTILAMVDESQAVSILAETVDDAAGEALDKGAKLLGMPYPGGPQIERVGREGDRTWHEFPLASKSKNDRRFSFSGLKTSLRYFLEKTPDSVIEDHLPDLCASYQYAVIRQLRVKTEQILKAFPGIKSIGLSGGVANNRTLRAEMESLARKSGCPLLMAEGRHTGDNATMIAFAAWANPQGIVDGALDELSFEPAWPLVW
ncbi:MAG: tRNA (adenosine(37)-N6)-threonylcarbamoyltransferase complex transferase subunit TsaD [Opitutales bacterium]